jgi:intracellular sulfur oxidation DsrE/DsrF family protein
MNPIRRKLPAFAALFALGASMHAQAAAPEAAGEDRVVYHVNDVASAREALVNISNHLGASPHAKVALVANGRGIFMLVKGEKDRVGEYATTIAELQAKGVRFNACRNSMNVRNIDPSTLAPGVQIVAAGVAELARLQGQEHYAYIKP